MNGRPRPIWVYLFGLLLLVAVTTAISITYVEIHSGRDSRSSALKEARYAAHTAAGQLGGFIATVKSTVQGLAANPQIAGTFTNPQGCTLSFAGIADADASHLDVVAPNGTVACSSRTVGMDGASYRNQRWLRAALARPLSLAPLVDPRTGAEAALISAPIPGGKGIVAAFVDLGPLGPKLASLYGGGLPVEFLVTTGDGRTVLARSIAPKRWIGKRTNGSSFDPFSAGSERPDLGGTMRLYSEAAVHDARWRFYVGEDAAAAIAAGGRLENRELAIAVLGLLAALLAVWLLHRTIVKPIRGLSRSLRASKPGRRTGPVPVGGPREVGELGKAINSLIESVESELRQRELAEESYRRLFESNPNPMWVYENETSRFLAVNNAAVESYGYSREEFLSMTIADVRPPEEQDRLREILALPDPGDGATTNVNIAGLWKHRRKDGSIRDVEVSSHAHEFEGTAARVVLALDVTERTLAEQALRHSEARYRDLFENATDLIATADIHSRLTDVNAAFSMALGYSREELIGRSIREFVPVEWHEQLQRARSEKLGGGAASVYEHELTVKGGSRITVEVASRAIYEDGEVVGVEAMCRDITARRQLEDQLRQAQRLEAVGRLAGGIAHDFNNLLTVIGGYTALLLEQRSGDAEPELQHIRDAAERAAALTRQLLAFSRQQVLQPGTIDLNTVVTGLAPMLERLIGEDIDYVNSLDDEIAPVLADRTQIEQVLVNLVVNARDAMPDGGRLTVTTASADLDADYVARYPEAAIGRHTMLSVSDEGTGIDQDTIDHIFEPFFTTKPVGVGTGLGLATVHGIVKQSGGNIWVYSELGHGTTFKIYLPEAESRDVDPTPREEPLVVPTGTETILVVEDESALRELVATTLSSRGYHVLVADDTAHALELAVTNEIDLLLADLVMPQMGGRELGDIIRAEQPMVRVLFMSGYTDDVVIRRGTLEPGAAFLEKPFSAQQLSGLIRKTLDEARPVPA